MKEVVVAEEVAKKEKEKREILAGKTRKVGFLVNFGLNFLYPQTIKSISIYRG